MRLNFTPVRLLLSTLAYSQWDRTSPAVIVNITFYNETERQGVPAVLINISSVTLPNDSRNEHICMKQAVIILLVSFLL